MTTYDQAIAGARAVLELFTLIGDSGLITPKFTSELDSDELVMIWDFEVMPEGKHAEVHIDPYYGDIAIYDEDGLFTEDQCGIDEIPSLLIKLGVPKNDG